MPHASREMSKPQDRKRCLSLLIRIHLVGVVDVGVIVWGAIG